VGSALGGSGLYGLDVALLEKLAPTVILTQRLCAVADQQVHGALEALPNRPEAIYLEPHSLEDILADIHRVADALLCPARGEQLVADLRSRIAAIRTRAKGALRPRVFCMEWVDPPYSGGHWMCDLVEIAGGKTALRCDTALRRASIGLRSLPTPPRSSLRAVVGLISPAEHGKWSCSHACRAYGTCLRFATDGYLPRMDRRISAARGRASSTAWRFSPTSSIRVRSRLPGRPNPGQRSRSRARRRELATLQAGAFDRGSAREPACHASREPASPQPSLAAHRKACP
jgi:hypothetical protein